VLKRSGTSLFSDPSGLSTPPSVTPPDESLTINAGGISFNPKTQKIVIKGTSTLVTAPAAFKCLLYQLSTSTTPSNIYLYRASGTFTIPTAPGTVITVITGTPLAWGPAAVGAGADWVFTVIGSTKQPLVPIPSTAQAFTCFSLSASGVEVGTTGRVSVAPVGRRRASRMMV
jgi:hypothetical protein